MLRRSVLFLSAGWIFGMSSLLAASPSNAGTKWSIAVFNFQPVNMDSIGYNMEVLYSVTSVLSETESVVVIPRRKMEEVLREKGLTQGSNQESALRAGRALGVNYVLFGKVEKKEAQIKSSLKLLSVTESRVVGSWITTFSSSQDITGKGPKLGAKIVKAIKEGSSAPVAADVKEEDEKEGEEIAIRGFMAKDRGSKVVLRWNFDPEDPIVRFHVYRSESKKGPYQFMGKTKKNIFEDHEVNEGNTYFYRLEMILSSGEEVAHDEITRITKAGDKTPHPPIVLSGKGLVRRARIKLAASLMNTEEDIEIDHYNLYRREGEKGQWKFSRSIEPKAGLEAGSSFQVRDRGLSDGRKYEYRLTSVAENGTESPFSDSVEVKTIGRPVLSVAKDNLLREIRLAWDSVQDASGYHLYRSTDQKEWRRVDTIEGAGQGQYIDTNSLKDETKYKYYLTAYGPSGETGASNKVEAKTKDLPPPPKSLEAQSGMVKMVSLSWKPLSDSDVGGYVVYRGEEGKKLREVGKVKGVKEDMYLDKGDAFHPLKDGQSYSYAVSSFNLFGAEGRLSPRATAETKPRPIQVKGFVAEYGQMRKDHVYLSWELNPEPDISRYVLYKYTGWRWSTLKECGFQTSSYKDYELEPDSRYRYKIIAVDEDSLKSDPAETREVVIPPEKKK